MNRRFFLKALCAGIVAARFAPDLLAAGIEQREQPVYLGWKNYTMVYRSYTKADGHRLLREAMANTRWVEPIYGLNWKMIGNTPGKRPAGGPADE